MIYDLARLKKGDGLLTDITTLLDHLQVPIWVWQNLFEFDKIDLSLTNVICNIRVYLCELLNEGNLYKGDQSWKHQSGMNTYELCLILNYPKKILETMTAAGVFNQIIV